MAQVELRIAGRSYDIACRDGEEARLTALADIVDDKAQQAAGSMVGMNESRQLLLVTLLLADELSALRHKAAASTAPPAAAPNPPLTEATPGLDVPDDGSRWPGLAPVLDELGERLERIAEAMEARIGQG